MRETKYRAWDEDNEIMYYSDQDYENCFFGFNKGAVVAWLRETEPQTLDEPAYDYGKPVGVMQFTGLHDWYAGDIIQKGTIVRAITVDWEHGLRFMLGKHQLCKQDAINGTKIGDIHESPELMEQK